MAGTVFMAKVMRRNQIQVFGASRFPLVAAVLLSLFFWASNQAAYAKSLDGLPIPSLAPMLESVTPAVVNLSLIHI